MKKYFNNEILEGGLRFWHPRSTWASSRATWLALAGSICPRSARCGCFERALSPDLVVLPLEPARPGLSRTPRGSIFEPETFVFSNFLRPRTFVAQNVQHRKNIVKTSTKRTSELLCIEPKSIKIRSAWVTKSIHQHGRT